MVVATAFVPSNYMVIPMGLRVTQRYVSTIRPSLRDLMHRTIRRLVVIDVESVSSDGDVSPRESGKSDKDGLMVGENAT